MLKVIPPDFINFQSNSGFASLKTDRFVRRLMLELGLISPLCEARLDDTHELMSFAMQTFSQLVINVKRCEALIKEDENVIKNFLCKVDLIGFILRDLLISFRILSSQENDDFFCSQVSSF